VKRERGYGLLRGNDKKYVDQLYGSRQNEVANNFIRERNAQREQVRRAELAERRQQEAAAQEQRRYDEIEYEEPDEGPDQEVPDYPEE
jgi:hypothetical protein